jgi:hypothetical protein
MKNEDQTVSGLTMTTSKPNPQLAICVRSDDPDLLTPRMIYEVLPDKSAAKSDYVRVIDNEGEEYLYPAEYFLFVKLPRAIKKTLFMTTASRSMATRRVSRA